MMIIYCINTSQAGYLTNTNIYDNTKNSINIKYDEKYIKQMFDQATEIATKTKLNADYVPGIVTILYGKELLQKGINTVLDAINTVPGFLKSKQILVVRGIGDVIHSGKIKILLNNIPVSISLTGFSNPTLNIPLEQVNRIEIIRGPGSSLYGKFAYAGVINIITNKGNNRIYVGYGEFNTRYDGISLFHKSENNNFDINLNISLQQNDKTGINAGYDALYRTPNKQFSFAPGEIDDSSNDSMGSLSISYEDFCFTGQYILDINGSGFGMSDVLPPLESDGDDFRFQYLFQTNWKPQISNEFGLNITVGYKEYTYDQYNMYLFPPGYTLPNGISYTNGMIGGPHYRENVIYSSLEANYNGFNNHQILFGMDYEQIRTFDVWACSNYELLKNNTGINSNNSSLPYLKKYTGDNNWLKEDIYREIFGIYLQDYFIATNKITITTGLRYDYYDDVGDKLSPRISGVFNLFENHIFKIQYAEAFRPPSFLEMYSMNNPITIGNINIKPEKIQTAEFGYILKGYNYNGKITVFYSKLNNLIIKKGILYDNIGSANTKGIEFEIDYKINKKLLIDGNFSFAKTYDNTTQQEIEGSANYLGNIAILYKIFAQNDLSFRYQYVGNRKRNPLDKRPDLDGYNCYAISANIKNIISHGLNFRLSINNLFNNDIKYPSSGYIDDYPSIGRNWLLVVSKKF